MSNRIIFTIGGARSGKSSFALNKASKIKGQKAYIATAEAFDSEMKERIEKHKKVRGDEWNTCEEPLKIVAVLSGIKDRYSVIVLDCLTLWLSNLLHKSIVPEDKIDEFINLLAGLSPRTTRVHGRRSSSSNRLTGLNGLNLFIISNEVGMGIVPDNKMAREFRDVAGFLNQKVAEIADEVYMVTAGIPIKIK